MIRIQLAQHFPNTQQKMKKTFNNQGVGAAIAYPRGGAEAMTVRRPRTTVRRS
jgi:hypothetical protein